MIQSFILALAAIASNRFCAPGRVRRSAAPAPGAGAGRRTVPGSAEPARGTRRSEFGIAFPGPFPQTGVRMYRLIFLSGRHEGKRLVVRQTATLVGRDPDCHLRLLDDDRLAPRHARFEELGTGVYLSSLDPENPVARNGQPVAGPIRLVHNDLLVLGQTRLQFQDLIAPHPRFRPSPGALQPATWLLVAAILAIEVGLLLLMADWPRRLVRPETEALDLAYAEAVRTAREQNTNGLARVEGKPPAPPSVVTLPGTKPSDAGRPAAGPAAAATGAPPAIAAVLQEADFTPVDTNALETARPAAVTADSPLDQARRTLAEATAAIQFADYAKAGRLLNQIHQSVPWFLPAYVEHARLLETRGDLDAARQRWIQLQGLAPADAPEYAQAKEESLRLERLLASQSRILQTPQPADLTALPRQIRFLEPMLQKMPGDADVAEMRVLNATLEAAADTPAVRNAAIQVFVAFYDATPDGRILPTRAIVSPSPMALGRAFADRRAVPFNATYVVPRGQRAQEARATGQSNAFYGYTLHVFAGQILQDAFAKPKKLLDFPLRTAAESEAEP